MSDLFPFFALLALALLAFVGLLPVVLAVCVALPGALGALVLAGAAAVAVAVPVLGVIA